MLNYVNNSFDKVLKPCDAQQFGTLTQSELTEKLILGHRAGEKNSKAKLPALTYMGVLDEAKYKSYLRKCEEQGGKPLGSRRAEFMRPTGLLMLDFDHISEQATDPLPTSPSMGRGFESPTKMWKQIYKGASERGFDLGKCMALAHITPSGDGLRLVVKRDEGKTIAEGQYHWVQEVLPWLGVEAKCDDVCKDISRLSFAPMESEILYFNPSLLFGELPEASDYPDGSLFGGDALRATLGTPPPLQGTPSMNRGGVGEVSTHPEGMQSTNCPSVYRGTSTECGGSSKQSAEQYPTDYNGIEYKEIIRRLEEQLGGRPEHGARNSFIFSMACNLRYICNDDPQWIAAILPTYGEEPQKHRQTIQSAINRPMSRNMPETLARALAVSAESTDNGQLTMDNGQLDTPPALPSALPEPLRMLTSCTPEYLRPAVAMAVFPSLGAHIKDTRFVYADKRSYEPTFINI